MASRYRVGIVSNGKIKLPTKDGEGAIQNAKEGTVFPKDEDGDIIKYEEGHSLHEALLDITGGVDPFEDHEKVMIEDTIYTYAEIQDMEVTKETIITPTTKNNGGL